MDMRNELTAYADANADRALIEPLAASLGVTAVYGTPGEDSDSPHLRLDRDGLALVGGGLELRGDFTHMLPRLRPQNLLGELLVRAAKIKSLGDNPTAIDATAGLGEDSLLLATAGFSVTMYEYNPVIAALLRDALRRGASVPELAQAVGRMRLFEVNSLEALPAAEPPQLILLDPMFPARQKSGLVKKKFQLLHYIEQPCGNEEALLRAAVSAHPKKIIIKRPAKGPYLAGVKPDYSIERGGIRFDCLTFSV